jgi:uncharacterized protein
MMANTQIAARWRGLSDDSIEHLVLRCSDAGILADSVLLNNRDENFAVRYRIRCDLLWRVRNCEIEVIGERRVELSTNGDGIWADGNGRDLPELNGAIDVDLSVTPFTNTLPIRRLALRKGQSANIMTAYVHFPDLTVAADPQRYTCLEPMRLYRYESLDIDSVREIEVDADGLVVNYPGLFRRVALQPVGK